jgi:hypothetical protein
MKIGDKWNQSARSRVLFLFPGSDMRARILPEASNCYCHPGKAGGSPRTLGPDNRRMNDGSDVHAFEPDWRLPSHANPEATLPSLRLRVRLKTG